MERRVIWPPRVIQQTPLGTLRDDTGNWLPRDIGRSSQLANGHVVVQFGDTFDHNRNGQFLGVKDNTCAIVPDTNNPTLSKYANHPDNNEVPVFVRQYPNEFDIPTKFWSFSGIVETGKGENGIIQGYTWFKVTRMDGNMQEDYLHMGIAKVEYDPANRRIRALRVTSDATDFGGMRASEDAAFPSFGSICAIRVDPHIYLYGQTQDGKKDVVLARVLIPLADSCAFYEFWAGNGWSSNVKDCCPVMSQIEHGQVFLTNMFGENSEYKYCFVGCSSWGDSKVLMARAINAEGPWSDLSALEVELYSSNPNRPPTGPFNYCMYPHPWALGFNAENGMERTGDLMITWSEGGVNGCVLAASIRLKMEERRLEDRTGLASVRDDVRRRVRFNFA
ncbi:hypothetical protein EG329_014436 [Mollisiaceae sp. DMI_Dod_QoI]|nr:hypothetical protein EG329_014436 [Helotiales sp. DMI_Dod_QoI]